jgi:thiol-disulfide isomerase/thioredoxin
MVTERQSAAITLTVLGFIVMAAAVYAYLVSSRADLPTEPEPPATLSLDATTVTGLLDEYGEPVELDAFLGRVQVLMSWASWCPQCHEQLPILEAVAARHPEVAVLAVNRAERSLHHNRFLASQPSYENITFLQDPNDTFYAALGGYTMPEIIIRDAEGIILTRYQTLRTADELSADINRARQQRDLRIVE